MTPAQSRAARGLLDLSQTELARAAGISLSTLADFERGKRDPIKNNLAAIQRALEAAGVIFTKGREPGVKLTGLTGERFKLLIERYEKDWLPSVKKRHPMKGELSLLLDLLGVDLRIDGKVRGRLTLRQAQDVFRKDGLFDVHEVDEWLMALLPK